MWRATVDGRQLTFHLAGINNQNFIMRDDETGTWWQQVSGEAIYGPLKGKTLEPVLADEISFATWRREYPSGRVLKPDDSVPWKRFSEDWEEDTGKLPVLTPAAADAPLPQREIVMGVKLDGVAKAYPLARITSEGAIVDTIGTVPVVVVLGEDGVSVRVFERRVDGAELELYRAKDGAPGLLVDATTGSRWDFTGRAVAGSLAGRELKQVLAIKDYWFDWKIYNPKTEVYAPPSLPK